MKTMHPATPPPVPGVKRKQVSSGPIPGVRITTEEQAIRVIGTVDGFNPDLYYLCDENPEGFFTVFSQSRSIREAGGSGSGGVWTVYPDGSYHMGQEGPG